MRLQGKKKIFLRRLLRKQPARSTLAANLLVFGEYGVVSKASGYLTANQKEAIRKLLARRLRPFGGKYWVNIDNFVSLTKKAKGSRMGKGRGKFFADRVPVRAGRLLCEFSGVDEVFARKIFASLSKKLPLPVVWVPRATSGLRCYN